MKRKERKPYETITFTPAPEMCSKIIKLKKETGHPASTIVVKCVEYALKK